MPEQRGKRGYVLGSSWRHHDRIVDYDPVTREFRPDPSRDTWAKYPFPIDSMIRNSVLYADEIVQPVNNFLPQAEIPYAEYLQGQGVLERVQFTMPDDGSMQAQM
jgi:hypothetical protein